MGNNHTPLDPKHQTISTAPTKESEPQVFDHREYIKPVEEPELSGEVVEYMKQHDAVTKKLPTHLKEIGATSPDEQPTQLQGPQLILSDEKIVQGLHQPISSSWRWLATLMEYLLKQAHISLKMVRGRIKRVITA